jgi:hypothetical protein
MRFFLAFFMFAQSAQADVLIHGPGSPTLDYRATLKANPDFRSPTEFLLKSRPGPGRREALLTAFASAQKAFLENSLGEARALFESVASMMSHADWPRADRQVFLHACLRLAQLEADSEGQNRWLARAVAVGDDTQAEAGLFPPPLLAGLKKFRAEIPRARVSREVFDNGWTMVLLNGHVCSAHNCAGFPMGGEKVRATFLSDTWQSVSLMLDARELTTVRPKAVAWVSGACAKTQFSAASSALRDARSFWGLECEALNSGSTLASGTGMGLTSGSTTYSEAIATPTSSGGAALNFNPSTPSQSLPTFEIKENSPAFYKSKWFWIGVGVLATGALIANDQKKKEEKEPTTTYGYQ